MAESAIDQEYRDKSTGHMFRQNLYMGLAASTFLGVLAGIAGMVIRSFSIEGMKASAALAAEAAKTGTAVATNFLGVTPIGWAVVAGMMAVGVCCTYMAQVEATKLKEVQDDALARKNAAEMQKCKERGVSQAIEYEQNCRADGKSWQEAVAKKPELVVSR